MGKRMKEAYDYSLEEIQAAVEEAWEDGIMKFSDSEVAIAGEPSKRRIIIEAAVVLGDDEE